MKYLSKNALSLCEIAAKEPELMEYMCVNSLISASDIDVFIDHANALPDPLLVDRLKQYKNSIFNQYNKRKQYNN